VSTSLYLTIFVRSSLRNNTIHVSLYIFSKHHLSKINSSNMLRLWHHFCIFVMQETNTRPTIPCPMSLTWVAFNFFCPSRSYQRLSVFRVVISPSLRHDVVVTSNWFSTSLGSCSSCSSRSSKRFGLCHSTDMLSLLLLEFRNIEVVYS